MSSIAKHHESELLGPRARLAIGERIRSRRVASGLSQAALGSPRTRSFVSQVEHGRIAPSLASLFAFAERLGLDPAELILGVKSDAPIGYNRAHGNAGTRPIIGSPRRGTRP
jgi:transcriptional regulator with XRE-family HTH domain